ncbi:InlB B-repeat-containing protein [Anaerolentibacter hominis]|uniref:InlB B-repeat-containing protein n=1 Tax=Anaerolentibacter hominis TaxID=3079009 RepID=UPI0031B7EF4F
MRKFMKGLSLFLVLFLVSGAVLPPVSAKADELEPEPGPEVTYTVTYKQGTAADGEAPVDETLYTEGESAVIQDNIGGLVHNKGNDKFSFAGWTASPGSQDVEYVPGESYEMYGNLTLYPVFIKDNDEGGTDPVYYTVRFAAGAGGSVEELSYQAEPGSVLSEAVTSVPVPSPDEFFGFSGWYLEGSRIAGSNDELLAVLREMTADQDYTFTAVFEIISNKPTHQLTIRYEFCPECRGDETLLPIEHISYEKEGSRYFVSVQSIDGYISDPENMVIGEMGTEDVVRTVVYHKDADGNNEADCKKEEAYYTVEYILDPELADEYVLTKGSEGTRYAEQKKVGDRMTAFGVWLFDKETKKIPTYAVSMTLLETVSGTKSGSPITFDAGQVLSVNASNAQEDAMVDYTTGFGHTLFEEGTTVRIMVTALHTNAYKVEYVLDEELRDRYVLSAGTDGITCTQKKKTSDRITSFNVFLRDKETDKNFFAVSMELQNDVAGTKDGKEYHYEKGTIVSVNADNERGDAKVNYDINFGHVYFKEGTVIQILVKAVSHTVKFYDGETVLKSQNVLHGGTAAAPDAPEKEGKKFKDWDSRDYEKVLKDTDIHAVYEDKEDDSGSAGPVPVVPGPDTSNTPDTPNTPNIPNVPDTPDTSPTDPQQPGQEPSGGEPSDTPSNEENPVSIDTPATDIIEGADQPVNQPAVTRPVGVAGVTVTNQTPALPETVTIPDNEVPLGNSPAADELQVAGQSNNTGYDLNVNNLEKLEDGPIPLGAGPEGMEESQPACILHFILILAAFLVLGANSLNLHIREKKIKKLEELLKAMEYNR